VRFENPVQQDEAWKAHARCIGKDPMIFFPPSAPSDAHVQRILNICHPCPVRKECLDYSLAHDELFGWWGGMSERERRRERKKRKSRGNRRDNDHARAVLDALERPKLKTPYTRDELQE
jgi:WhiB family redox-sensing transcriptional regulator